MNSFEVIEDYSQIDPSQIDDLSFIDETPSTGSTFIDTALALMPWLIGIFLVIFVAAVVFIIYAQVRNYQKAKSAGLDPLTLQTDMAARLAQSQVLAPAKSIEAKLAELDQLRSRGVISSDEYAQARLDALKS
ncbi:SHOCT domain-containing protein [Glutamicibacter sp. JC586]|uniref:SHOCT domain-containing protein n=1 Tax=Glutamicibacter sp. JC586 TaxID=2590552 RepID=UPI001356917E|nr:SHOCT domain-containing protein [Glutamicibacter sp. JC586]